MEDVGTGHLGPFRPSPQPAPVDLSGQGLSAVCASGPGRSCQRCLSSGALMKPTAGGPQGRKSCKQNCKQFSGLESWDQGVGRPGVGAGPFPSLQVAASHCVFSGQWERDRERERRRWIGREGSRESETEPGSRVSPHRGTFPITGLILLTSVNPHHFPDGPPLPPSTSWLWGRDADAQASGVWQLPWVTLPPSADRGWAGPFRGPGV